MAGDSEFQPSSKWTHERWQRVDQLLQSALEREPEQRVAFLREVCAGDESMLREVESLFILTRTSRRFLGESASRGCAGKFRNRTPCVAGGAPGLVLTNFCPFWGQAAWERSIARQTHG